MYFPFLLLASGLRQVQGIKATYDNSPSSSAQLDGELSLTLDFNSQDKEKY